MTHTAAVTPGSTGAPFDHGNARPDAIRRSGLLRVLGRSVSAALPLLWFFGLSGHALGEEAEKNYSISLVKTAELDKDVREIGDKKILTEDYTVKRGEHLWQVLREKGLLEPKAAAMEELLRVLKQLNPSLHDLNLVHPGQHVIIPLKIVPIQPTAGPKPSAAPEKISLSELSEEDLRMYTVKHGDNLTRIAKGHLAGADRDRTHEYLEMVRKMNPSIRDPNRIYPGQVIRLPIFSPQAVRKRIEPMPLEAREPTRPGASEKPEVGKMAEALGRIFSEMGEEWIQTGEHFIPLQSGGQMDLKASSFPILALRTGRRVVVDLQGTLPERVPKLIESSWGNYKVVRLSSEDDPASALNKVIDACGYAEVRRNGEPLELGGEIPFRLSGQWVVRVPKDAGYGFTGAVIRLRRDSEPGIPEGMKRHVEGLGTKIIEFPRTDEKEAASADSAETLAPADPPSLTRELLRISGKPFSSDVDIPVFQSRGAEFKLIIRADFLLKVNERDAVIDLHGLSPEVISLLKEHGFLVLSLKDVQDPLEMLTRTLAFVGVAFDPGPLRIEVPPRSRPAPVSFVINGAVFQGMGGKTLATRLDLPPEIAAYLSRNGYKILRVSFS